MQPCSLSQPVHRAHCPSLRRLYSVAPIHSSGTNLHRRQQTSVQAVQSKSRGSLLVVAGEKQGSNSATKRRLSGPPGLPPINDDSGGGGGGGDGWGWERTVRNVAPNFLFIGLYYLVMSNGGDNFGKGLFGGGDGGGGGGEGGGGGGGGDGGGGGGNGGGGDQPPRNPNQNKAVEEEDSDEDESSRRRARRRQ